jgi:hypothetical protein
MDEFLNASFMAWNWRRGFFSVRRAKGLLFACCIVLHVVSIALLPQEHSESVFHRSLSRLSELCGVPLMGSQKVTRILAG